MDVVCCPGVLCDLLYGVNCLVYDVLICCLHCGWWLMFACCLVSGALFRWLCVGCLVWFVRCCMSYCVLFNV